MKLYSTNTNARKMQLKQELHNVQRKNLNINEYSLKVKGLADSLVSIRAPVDDEDLVSVTFVLGRIMHSFGHPLESVKHFLIFRNLLLSC